ncbi:DHA2 family efflux MFS transporter permease subunit [Arthrobacter frigidicola]|nr:DHA2 family efflux MFS transporter permease subunit [Arthrobacter frigidicola]
MPKNTAARPHPGESRVTTAPNAPAADPRRWVALAVIAVSTLMVVLDSTIVTIALPHAQADLGISNADRQWAVTAYALAFGGLLLLGGRIADFAGRKRVFLISALGFAAASALGGLAVDPAMLFGARALQGAFAALLAPAGLSLLVVTFTNPKELAKAFGVYAAVQGVGGAIGLILGGVLTEYVSWRWTLLVNVPIAVAAFLAALPTLRESRAPGSRRYDIPGALLVTSGLAALVYGFTLAAEGTGWSAPSTLGLLGAGVALLAAFVVVETRSASPLLPLRVVLDRNRGGALLASVLIFGGLFGMLFFLTYYFQVNLDYSPIRAGLAFLPFSLGLITTAALASSLLPRFGPKPLLVAGATLATLGTFWLTSLNESSSYVGSVLPIELVISIGVGIALVPLSSVAMHGIDPEDAGVGAAMLNVSQQVGGALGTAVLNTIYVSAYAGFLATNPGTAEGSLAPYLEGYRTAFTLSAILMAAALIVLILLVNARRSADPVAVPEG